MLPALAQQQADWLQHVREQVAAGAVLQEELTFRRYNHWRDAVLLVCFCFLEHFPYRQLHMVWRLQGLWQFFRGDMIWRPMQRVGFPTSSKPR